ncbi:uncharacterized protein [Parasteatoda tepidariorum]|uniref:uncharacterized protein isoform X1 n=1 Tax=Parasteatoda tepidariorum TaxID=114398 RepID=UPI0039BCB6FB
MSGEDKLRLKKNLQSLLNKAVMRTTVLHFQRYHPYEKVQSPTEPVRRPCVIYVHSSHTFQNDYRSPVIVRLRPADVPPVAVIPRRSTRAAHVVQRYDPETRSLDLLRERYNLIFFLKYGMYVSYHFKNLQCVNFKKNLVMLTKMIYFSEDGLNLNASGKGNIAKYESGRSTTKL